MIEARRLKHIFSPLLFSSMEAVSQNCTYFGVIGFDRNLRSSAVFFDEVHMMFMLHIVPRVHTKYTLIPGIFYGVGDV